jgi:hypothetical protein
MPSVSHQPYRTYAPISTGLELLMDIEMLNKFLKVVISAVILSASGYANIASADLVFTPPTTSYTSFQWSATCYDCKGDIGVMPDDRQDWTPVTGTITLRDYEFGDEINNDNFESFYYEGISEHLPTFGVGNSMIPNIQYSANEISGNLLVDGTFNLFMAASLQPFLFVKPLACISDECPPTPPITRIDFPSDLIIDINTDGLWDITAYKPKQLCQGNDFWDPMKNACINEEEAPPMREEPKLESPVVEIVLLDYGQDFVLSGFDTNNKGPISEVPAPSTLAIFALGLMGLGLRRFKK